MTTLPYDERLEAVVLGAMLNSIDYVSEGCDRLSDADFHMNKHKMLFMAMKALWKSDSSVDAQLTITALYQSKSLDGCGGIGYILELAQLGAFQDNFDEYCDKLQEYTHRRILMGVASDIIVKAGQGSDPCEKLTSELLNKFSAIGEKRDSCFRLSDVTSKFHKELSFQDYVAECRDAFSLGKSLFEGIPTGYPLLDKKLGGLGNGRFIVIGARTGMGKTTFLCSLLINLFTKQPDTKMIFFSLEMPARDLTTKIIGAYCGISFDRIQDGNLTLEEVQRIEAVMPQVNSWQLYYEDQFGITLSKFKARVRRAVALHGINCLFIDYLTKIKPDKKNASKHLDVDEVSKGLQDLALELNIPVVCLAQLNRQSATRENKSPTLSDFRESGSIEEDADVCILLHRPQYYNPHEKPGILQVHVAKNRQRSYTGTIEFEYQQGRYFELEPIQEEIKKCSHPYKDEYDDFTP